MIKITKRNGNEIVRKKYKNENDFKNEKPCYMGFEKINKIDFSKSYVKKLYCTTICRNYYCFGTSWDMRCKENRKPIEQVVTECPKFKKAKEMYNEMIDKMLNDDDFYNFCQFMNKKLSQGKYGNCESRLEIFLAIFNENRFSENRNEIKFKNR